MRNAEAGTANANLNLDFAATYWAANGAPRNKLVLGMATYGRCFTLSNANNNGLGAPTNGPCNAGQYTREAGFLSYYEICSFLKQSGVTTVFQAEQRAPYSYVGNQWVGYDNAQSLREKVTYVRNGGYGGWMVWCKDLDDFNNQQCGAGNYPLINTLNQALAEHENRH